jgi:hypothetical protein
MKSWQQAFEDALISGTAASLCSAAALAICGKIERDTAAGPNNGPSQWVWGEGAAYERRATLRHTAVGYAIHHAMSIFWATLHEKLQRSHNEHEPIEKIFAKCAATAGAACFVDYQLTPRRLRPGFEKQLSRRSLFVVYASFAAGLAIGQSLKRLNRPAAQARA